MRCKDGAWCGVLCACLCVHVHRARMYVRRVLQQGCRARVSAILSRMTFDELRHQFSPRGDTPSHGTV